MHELVRVIKPERVLTSASTIAKRPSENGSRPIWTPMPGASGRLITFACRAASRSGSSSPAASLPAEDQACRQAALSPARRIASHEGCLSDGKIKVESNHLICKNKHAEAWLLRLGGPSRSFARRCCLSFVGACLAKSDNELRPCQKGCGSDEISIMFALALPPANMARSHLSGSPSRGHGPHWAKGAGGDWSAGDSDSRYYARGASPNANSDDVELARQRQTGQQTGACLLSRPPASQPPISRAT